MKFLECWFGNNFLNGDTFIDFLKDGFKIFIFLFLPWVLLGSSLIIETLINFLIGG